jgi:phage tail-like protein
MTTSTQTTRAYSAAHFVLELDGSKDIGIIRSVDGGGVKSEIVTYHMGDNHDLWRQIGKPKYEDLKIEFGMSFSEGFYKWIQSFFSGEVERKNGAIVAGDFHYKERARRKFQEAIISEITFPKLDGSDKNACYMQATIVPEILRFEKGNPSTDMKVAVGQLRQKLWTSSNFQLTLDIPGVADKCGRCTKIDSFTIKQEVQEYHSGEHRDPIRVPGRLDFPNITLYIPESDAQPFIAHYTKHGIEGHVQAATRYTGAIELRDNSASELCRVSLFGVDIANVSTDKAEAGSEKIKEVKIEISVERMEFKYVNSAVD